MRLSIGDLTTGLAFCHRAHSMRSRVYKTARCPSVRQSVCPISQTQQRRAAGLLLSAVRARYRSIAPGARVRSTALSSKCGQRYVDSRINEAEHRQLHYLQSRRFPLARTFGHVTLSLWMRETATGRGRYTDT